MTSIEDLHRASVLKVSSKILKTVKKAPRSNKTVVFLGGECDGNNPWRSELKEEFKGTLFFIDPYDSNWDPKDNIYDELAGMLVSDYVIFYRGGNGTKKEKEFLKLTNRKYKEFKSLDKLKDFLKNLNSYKSGSQNIRDLKLEDLGNKQRFFQDDHYGPNQDKTVFYSNKNDQDEYGVFLVNKTGNELDFVRVRSPGWVLVGNVFSGAFKEIDQKDIVEFPTEYYHNKTANIPTLSNELDAIANEVENQDLRIALAIDRISDAVDAMINPG